MDPHNSEIFATLAELSRSKFWFPFGWQETPCPVGFMPRSTTTPRRQQMNENRENNRDVVLKHQVDAINNSHVPAASPSAVVFGRDSKWK